MNLKHYAKLQTYTEGDIPVTNITNSAKFVHLHHHLPPHVPYNFKVIPMYQVISLHLSVFQYVSLKKKKRTHYTYPHCSFFLIYKFIYLFIYFWLCWVFVSVQGLSLVAASGGHSSSLCAGLSVSRPLLLRSTGSRCAGSVVVAHGPSCSAACGIFPDQGSNPRLLHWQADSQPLHHQ